MILAKVLILLGFAFGLSERSFVLWRSQDWQDFLLLLTASGVAGLVVLSWAS